MDETLLKIRVLTRAEMTLAKANARRIAARTRLYTIALGMILLTVIMVNIAAYEYLSAIKGEPVAALIVASVNAVLAILVIYVASRIKPGPEEEMVKEIRELALTELSADADVINRNSLRSVQMLSASVPGSLLFQEPWVLPRLVWDP